MSSRKEILNRLDCYYHVIQTTILSKQHPASGLMPASTAITSHGDYTDAWVRDNVYSIYAVYGLALAYRRIDDNTGRAFELQYSVIKLMRGLLFAMMRQAHKVEQFKQTQSLEHALHAKYNTTTGETVVGDFEWGHLQIDATSLFLLALADMTTAGFSIIYTQDEVDFVQNLVFYIERAYRTPDYGIWERGNKINHGQPELNSSSIGMAVSALRAIDGINLFGVRGGPSTSIHVLPDEFTRNSTTLHSFLPRESNSKEIDGSVLSVIGFPAFAVNDPDLVQKTREEAIKKLEGNYGLKRFLRDGHQTVLEDTSRLHYNPNELQMFEDIESEWPLFFTYLVLDGLFTGQPEMAEEYRKKLEALVVMEGDIPLLPELYFVPKESIEAEKKKPHSQERVPNENVPLVWALSLYFLGGLVTEKLVSPSEVDPLGRRFHKMRNENQIQIVLLAEDASLQSTLSTYGVETQTLEQIPSNTTILPAQALVDVYAGLGLNTKLSMSGRPKRPIGVLGTCRLYKMEGQLYAFTPHFMDNNEFYINSDPDYLVSEFENELNFTNLHWYYPGRPTMVVLLTHSLLGAARTHDSKNLLNFFSSLRSGEACNVRVRLCRLAETIHTSNIESLDFLTHKVDWSRIIHRSQHKKDKRLGFNKTMTQASTPHGGRTPRRRSFYGKSLTSPLDKIQDGIYFDDLASALSMVKKDQEEFKLKEPTCESPVQEKTSVLPVHKAVSPNEMLALTLGDDTQFAQAVESLKASVNLYDQIDLLQYLISCRPKSYHIHEIDATISDLLEEVYLKSKRLQYWSIARQAAGLLKKNVPSLTINVTDLVIRQKQVSIGTGPTEYFISMPVPPDTLNKMISDHCNDDVREGPVVQEIVTYLGNLIRTQPELFAGILRLRTHNIIIALREEISRNQGCDEEEAVEKLMQLSPYELKSLLNTLLTGPDLCSPHVVENSYIPLLASDQLVIRAQSGGYHAGNFAQVEINGSLMDAKSRGIHVWRAVILERASFDTHASEEESASFVQCLKGLSTGSVLVMASKDEFTEHLTEEALLAMEQIGSRVIRQVNYRDSYVFIGQIGSDVLEAHQCSTEGPTEKIERSVRIDPSQLEENEPVTASNVYRQFPNSNGTWLHRRKNDGSLNRVPVQFFPQVWSVLERCKGLVIKNHVLPRDPTVLEKTAEEFNFALAVESFLGRFVDPAERQVAVQVLSIVYNEKVVIGAQAELDLSKIIERSAELFWKKWAKPTQADYKMQASTLFFDLPSEGTESTETYIRLCLADLFN
ncbi:hypothetical protein CU098_008224 [Rhizopus stolonifer]|uniref:Phosphorylase kinase alphabeta n=1 Tax=Rhizopus stolonifer TaxID=4846 RepID=A0A367KN54_RHIST|nr:hypothetical protein CU098_008224 [Rhizopus stolonifer]